MCPNPQGIIVNYTNTNIPTYVQKSKKHVWTSAFLIIEMTEVEGSKGLNFNIVGRLLPEGTEEETETFWFRGAATTRKRPVVGDVITYPRSKLDSPEWHTREDFERDWELRVKKPEGANVENTKLEGIRPGINLNKITNIDLRPALPTKDDPLFRNRDEVVEIEVDDVHRHTVLAARFRQFNPKIGDHFFSEGGQAVFYTPQEFNRLVFTAFDAKYKQEQ
jgi:hypothetical protein